MAAPFAICNLHDPPQDILACPCPMGDHGSDYYRPKLVAALAEIARLRALGLEACDALTTASTGFAEVGDTLWADLYRTKAEHIRKEMTRG